MLIAAPCSWAVDMTVREFVAVNFRADNDCRSSSSSATGMITREQLIAV